jgi:hypothetical protein
MLGLLLFLSLAFTLLLSPAEFIKTRVLRLSFLLLFRLLIFPFTC